MIDHTRMKIYSCIAILLLLMPTVSKAQTHELELAQVGDSIEDLTPDNWIVLSVAYGDLNKDGISDMVFAVEDTDIHNFVLNDGMGIDTLNQNPRIMGIYFGDENGQYNLKLQSDSFIILRETPVMDEPFDGVEIDETGILSIHFHFWFSAGSWFMSSHQYKFRYQENQFALIGYESSERHRGSGETNDYSVNFLSKKMSIHNTIIDEVTDEEIITEQWIDFELKKLKTITSLKEPFKWEFQGYIF